MKVTISHFFAHLSTVCNLCFCLEITNESINKHSYLGGGWVLSVAVGLNLKSFHPG